MKGRRVPLRRIRLATGLKGMQMTSRVDDVLSPGDRWGLGGYLPSLVGG